MYSSCKFSDTADCNFVGPAAELAAHAVNCEKDHDNTVLKLENAKLEAEIAALRAQVAASSRSRKNRATD